MINHTPVFSLAAALIIFAQPSVAQQSPEDFSKPSCPEKWWAITHPFVACKAYKLTVKAREASRKMADDSLLDHDANGGQVDAFRHAYWMALLSQNISPRKAKKLGVAHEKGDYKAFKKYRMEEGLLPDSMASVMDLCNNDSGIATGTANKELAENELKTLVKQKVLAGEMKILKKDKDKNYLTCDGAVIDPKKYLHQWNIPKCLVNSNANQH
jgi:hypothetical protein